MGQHDESGRKEHAIYYLSKKFTDCESRYLMLETIKDNIDKKTPGYVASLFEMSREYRNSLESRHPEH